MNFFGREIGRNESVPVPHNNKDFGSELKSSQLINLSNKIAFGDQLGFLVMDPPNGRAESGNICQHLTERTDARVIMQSACFYFGLKWHAADTPRPSRAGAEPVEPQLRV